ncbi:MAG: response regulator [Alphaproteobacteria bacterium]
MLTFLQMDDERMESLRSPLPWVFVVIFLFGISLISFLFLNKIIAIIGAILGLIILCYIFLLMGRKQIARHFTLLGQGLYHSPQGVIITDVSGKSLWCNRAFRILLPGVVPPDIKRGNIMEGLELYLANKEDIEAIYRMLQLATTGFEDRMTIMVRLPNGEPASRYIFVSPIEAQEAILWQVTQLQEEAAALGYSQKEPQNSSHFESFANQTLVAEACSEIIDDMPCGWFSMNEEGVILSANEGFLKIVGASKAQISKGDFHLSDYIIDAKPMEYSESSALIQGPESQNMNGIIHIRRRNNGQTVKAWLYQTSQLDEKGEFKATNSIIIPEPKDISQQQEAMQATAQQMVQQPHSIVQSQLSASDIPVRFDDIPLPLIWIDAHRNIKQVSHAFSHLFNQNKDSLAGTSFAQLFSPKESERLQTFLYRVSAGAKSLTLEGLSGEDSLSVRLYAVNASMEDPNEILLAAEDISETYALRSKMSEVEKDRMIGQAAGKIIHDFKNMLAAIIGGAESIMERVEPEDSIYPDAHTILDSAFRADKLAKWLNRMNRSETGERKWLKVDSLLTNARAPLQSALGKQYELKVNPGDDVYGIRVEETAFDQILMNLITNARDAMDENNKERKGGMVTISAEKHILNKIHQGFPDEIPLGEWVVVKVQDTGSGIPAHILERIFEKRFTTKKAGSGTGIGLDSVRQMVRGQDGFVNVMTQEGQGTCFEIWLPFEEEPAATQQQAKKYIPTDLSGVGRILVVEDEERARGYTVRALRQRGYEVLEALDGQEGLEIVLNEKGNFDLVVSDISMPRLDGASMIKKFRETYPDIPVLIVSGNSGEDLDRDLEKVGNVPFLAKPYTLEGLVIKVKDILTEQQRQNNVGQKPSDNQDKQGNLFDIFASQGTKTQPLDPQKPPQKPAVALPSLYDIKENETQKPLIILADDEESARIFMARKLQSAGFEVFEAEDGKDGLELALDAMNKNLLKLVVSDVNMITMHGDEMAAHIWAKMPNLPIVFLSGDIGGLRDSIKNPNAYYMEKPVRPNELLAKVQEILGLAQ